MSEKKFAVFDIDGTYFRSHLFYEIVLEMARQDELHPDINSHALELYDKWKNRAHNKSFEEFDMKTITKLRSKVLELDPKVYDEYVNNYLPKTLDQIYMWPKELKDKLQADNYMVIALSGSRIEEVEVFAKHHKFDDWIGQTFHRKKDGNAYTGEITTTFDNKEKLLTDFVRKHNLTYEGSYAIGDTGSDIAMLKLVENPIAFNPNHSLLEHAQKKGWKIVLERKSIAYTLEKGKDGSYLLAETK